MWQSTPIRIVQCAFCEKLVVIAHSKPVSYQNPHSRKFYSSIECRGIPQEEIDHINDLYAGMRRHARQMLKDAIEIGDWFIKSRKKLGPEVIWGKWLEKNFPKITRWSIWRYEKLPANREFLATIMCNEYRSHSYRSVAHDFQQEKMAKPRVRTIVVKPDADPIALLEAKLKNYVINLWMLRPGVVYEMLLERLELNP
jgi:hypothetical protein